WIISTIIIRVVKRIISIRIISVAISKTNCYRRSINRILNSVAYLGFLFILVIVRVSSLITLVGVYISALYRSRRIINIVRRLGGTICSAATAKSNHGTKK